MATSSPLGTESPDGTIVALLPGLALLLGLPHFFCLNKEQGRPGNEVSGSLLYKPLLYEGHYCAGM